MDTGYSPEQEALRDSVARFLDERAPLRHARERWGDPRGCDPRVWKGLAELGVTGLLVPEAYGGADGGLRDMGVVLEEMGQRVHPGPFPFSAIGAVWAARELRVPELLPRLADGTRVGALALAEPEAAFRDWSRPRTQVRQGVSGAPALDGVKLDVDGAPAADHFFVPAGDAVYLVEASAPGLRVEPTPGSDGTRCAATLHLRETPTRRVGPLSRLRGAVDRVLIGLSAEGLGAAQAALDLAVAYAKERIQFGRPIGAFQAVSHLCADMLQSVELARGSIHYALWAADAADAAECHRAAALAKAYASEAFAKLAADAIQVFGGLGFSWESDVQLYYKRLLALEQSWGGAGEWLEEVCGQLIGGRPFPSKSDITCRSPAGAARPGAADRGASR